MPKRRASDENILGIFADGERSGRKPRQEKSSGDLTKGISFVRGQTLQPTSVPAPPKEEKNKEQDEDSDVDSRFVLDASLPSANFTPAVEGPKLPARNKLSFHQMSSNYGKGFAMLQKMGFTGGGLGRHNDGIANPIEVQKRQTKMGLQDDGEMVDQDLYGNEGGRRTIEELLGTISKPKQSDEPKISDGWKRDGKSKRPKTIYKKAEEASGEVPAMRIVDMRGPEVKVASSFAELAANLAGDSVRSLKEFRHNTRLLVSRYEDKVRAAAERKRHCENIILAAAKEQERLQAADNISESDVKGCKELVLEIESLREQQDEASITLSELADSFKRLERTRPKEFHLLSAMDVAFALALPTAKRELSTWQPFKAPEDGLKAISKWQQLGDKERFSALLDASLIPQLRKALVAWSPRDFEPCIALMETCKKALHLDVAEALIAEVVLPRLRSELEVWDPRIDKVSAHLWLHPWLPVLGRKMEMLWTPIRFKISGCLERWDSNDPSAHGLLKPWQQVFDASNWEPLLEKVLSRLEKALLDTPIKPDGQDLKALKSLFTWLDLAPLENVARVLETAFFPQWHSALKQWLRTKGCNFSEVLQWYQGWKALFPPELREQLVVQRHLAHGLEVMKHMMANGSDLDEEPAAPQRPSHANLPPTSARNLPVEEVSLSLSDYITQVAAEEGLIFLPKKQQRNGKQVYQLGAATIQLEKNLIYVAPKGEGEWKAASMDELLKLAKVTKK
ncbi:unnamed protein product [Durusdinium trenchii]|uniref:Septin and tuftelin-interacting protein 1 homolog 1 (Nineteen complex-related protein 1 homolog) (AtNTR1) (Protein SPLICEOSOMAL TIMEKEEPER LOCUS 1) n=2 Tax=Durusdinium trenchii TaxID=1381693 RepID=A0ABP0QD63_9DINO